MLAFVCSAPSWEGLHCNHESRHKTQQVNVRSIVFESTPSRRYSRIVPLHVHCSTQRAASQYGSVHHRIFSLHSLMLAAGTCYFGHVIVNACRPYHVTSCYYWHVYFTELGSRIDVCSSYHVFYQITTAQLKVLGRRLPIEKYAIAVAKPHSGHTTSADAEVGKDVSMQFDMTVEI